MRIYELAKALDEPGLEAELEHRLVDEWMPGEYHFSAASQLAMEGNRKAVALLANFGAHLTYIAIGAARGGHRAWAEKLRRAGADHHYIAMGAAMGGHSEYVEFLRELHAGSDLILRGEELHRRARDLDSMANDANFYWHPNLPGKVQPAGLDPFLATTSDAATRGDLEQAIKRCSRFWTPSRLSDVSALSHCFAQGRHFPDLNRTRSVEEEKVATKKILRFLLALPPKLVPDFIYAFRWDYYPIPVSLEKRARLLFKARSENNLSFKVALWKTDPKNHVLLMILTALFINTDPRLDKSLPPLPKDVLNYIFYLACDVPLTRKEREQLAFTTAKSMLTGSLKRYPSVATNHNSRARSFLKTLEATQEPTLFKNAVITQAERLKNPTLPASSEAKHDQPLSNSTVDGYHKIIGFWANRFIPVNQVPYVFEENQNGGCTIC